MITSSSSSSRRTTTALGWRRRARLSNIRKETTLVIKTKHDSIAKCEMQTSMIQNVSKARTSTTAHHVMRAKCEMPMRMMRTVSKALTSTTAPTHEEEEDRVNARSFGEVDEREIRESVKKRVKEAKIRALDEAERVNNIVHEYDETNELIRVSEISGPGVAENARLVANGINNYDDDDDKKKKIEELERVVVQKGKTCERLEASLNETLRKERLKNEQLARMQRESAENDSKFQEKVHRIELETKAKMKEELELMMKTRREEEEETSSSSSSLSSSNEAIAKEVEEKTRENQTLMNEIIILKHKVDRIDQLENKIVVLNKKIEANENLEREIERLRAEIEMNNKLDSDAATLINGKELNNLIDENESMKEEIDTLLTNAETLKQTIQTTQSSIELFKETTKRFEMETSELFDERDALVAKILKLETSLEQSIKEQEKLRKELHETKSKILTVASSSSTTAITPSFSSSGSRDVVDESELRRQGVPIGFELDALAKEAGDLAYKKICEYQNEAAMIEAARIVDSRNTAKNSIKKFDNASENVRNVYTCVSRPLAGTRVTIFYNRKQLINSAGSNGQEKTLFAMIGYNGWSLQHALKVDLQPIQNFHAQPQNHDVEKCEWWELAIDVPSEAMVIDFVIGDSKGKFDNNNGKDYHIETATESDDVNVTVDDSREAQIDRELETLLDKRKEKNLEQLAFARVHAENAVRTKASLLAKKAISSIKGENRVYTDPLRPKAGDKVTIRYRPEGGPLTFARAIYCTVNFNRIQNHPDRQVNVDMRGGINGGTLEATINVPLDAHVVDFSFKDNGIFIDDNEGAEYHCDVIGASGVAPKLKIAHLAVEMAPIAKVGGLGDVVTALSRSVQEQGHTVDVYVPKYDCMNYKEIEGLRKVDQFHFGNDVVNIYKGFVEGIKVTFVDPENGHFRVGCIYGRGDDHVRFQFFSNACVSYMKRANCFPDVLHVHDWQTAPAIWNVERPKTTATALTIHNLQFGQDLIRRAMIECTFATTVSPTYAEEIKNHPSINVIPKHESGKFKGIRNGIDNDIWDPSNDEFLPKSYDWKNCKEGKREAKLELLKRMRLDVTDFDSKPVIACVTRLTEQKGVHLIKKACRYALEKGAYFVLLGSAPDNRIANDFANLANEMKQQHPGRGGFFFSYDEPLSHLIYAGADIFCVPSIFEPCGLTQMIAMRYGAVPLVRRTGGLRDTVFDVQLDPARAVSYNKSCNGYNFDGEHESDIEHALSRALADYFDHIKWSELDLPRACMRQDWSWAAPSERYIDQYWFAKRKCESFK
jgi:starch synthase